MHQQPRELDDAPREIWLLASRLLGDDVPTTQRYPHICGQRVKAEDTITGTQNLIYRERDCAACARATGRRGR